MSMLEVRATALIQRPPDVVRCHFLDMQHHIDHGVHQGVKYTILTEEPGRLRLTQDFKVLGLPKHDELVLYATPDGRVIQEFLRGDFAGGGIEITFEDEAGGTRLRAVLHAPLRGINKLLKPLIRRQVEKITEQALAEDRRDLEHGYEPGTWAQGALARARAA